MFVFCFVFLFVCLLLFFFCLFVWVFLFVCFLFLLFFCLFVCLFFCFFLGGGGGGSFHVATSSHRHAPNGREVSEIVYWCVMTHLLCFLLQHPLGVVVVVLLLLGVVSLLFCLCLLDFLKAWLVGWFVVFLGLF